MRSSSVYPNYATATLPATTQLSMAQMGVATIPAIPNTSTAAIPRMTGRVPFGSVASVANVPNYSQPLTTSTSRPMAPTYPTNGANFIGLVGASTPSMYGIQAISPNALNATLPAGYSNSFAKPTNTTPTYTSGYAYGDLPKAVVEPVYASPEVQYIPNDHHEVENVYQKLDAALNRNSLLLSPKPQMPMPERKPTPMVSPIIPPIVSPKPTPMVSPIIPPIVSPIVPQPEPPQPEEHHATTFVGKIEEKVMDTVHSVEEKVSNVVHGVEHAVEEKVHAVEEAVEEKVHVVEEKVAGVVHAVHDKVSGFFGMIGGLFHKKHTGKGKGPHGDEIGKGSTVEVNLGDGSTQRGHVVQHGDDEHIIQLHNFPPGQYHAVPVDAVSHVTDFAPAVGTGVEVLYDGVWYSGLVRALPMEGDARPLYTVACHCDEEGQVTYADEASIRPLLSPEERMVVESHMQAIRQQQEAENAAAALRQKAEDEATRKADFKKKFDSVGLTAFYPSFVSSGYDTEDALAHMHDGELETFGMKAGHVAKFYQAFPRGSPYVLSNVHLKSTATGIAYRRTKDINEDSHRIAHFGEVMYGTEQEGGWLKVGNVYVPMEVCGKRVVFAQGMEPTEEAGEDEESEENSKGMVAKVEDKVKSGLHAFAHMLHFG